MPGPRLFSALAFLVLGSVGWQSAMGRQEASSHPVIGSGAHRYRWRGDWAKLPADMTLGNTHGCVVVDRQDRVYVNTDSRHAVLVFSPEGELLDAWGEELAGGLHGMALVEEEGVEVLYLTHTQLHRVAKATLDGEILWSLGFPEESGIYPKEARFRPTSVAVTEGGDFFVADGYGASWVHRYDAEANYVGSFGGPGREPGRMRIPHGIERQGHGQAGVLVSDRMNSRLQRFNLEGKHMAVLGEDLRRPCHTHTTEEGIWVPDLDGRVTLLDHTGEVIVHLGENPVEQLRGKNGIPSEQWVPGHFLAPHCAATDSRGNLYVVDWVAEGRITKLERLPD